MLTLPLKFVFWCLDQFHVTQKDWERQAILQIIGLGLLLGAGMTAATLLAKWANTLLLNH